MAGAAARSSSRPGAAAGRKGAKPAARRGTAKPTAIGRVFARPGMIVAGATFAAVMTGIVANALLLQHGHHPSPLFTPLPAEATAPAPMLAPAVPAPQAAAPAPATPASVSRQIAGEPAGTTEAPAAAVRKAATKPAHAAAQVVKPTRKPAAPHRDAIGDLLAKQGR